jgi:hypothetical protein
MLRETLRAPPRRRDRSIFRLSAHRSNRPQAHCWSVSFWRPSGVYGAANYEDLPPPIMDGGCDDIRVSHIVGDVESQIFAKCSPTFAAAQGDEVTPPRTC